MLLSSLSPTAASRRGAVLILTLAVVVILTILLVGFVTVVTRDRGASQSYGQSLRAEQIGLGGLDQVVAQLQAEISDPSLSVANGASPYILYVPIANTNAVPQRMLALPPNLVTITKVSTNGVPLFRATSATSAQTSTNLASPSLTTSLSLNGRSIGISRWNKPLLTTSPNNFPAPCWVIVTRNGPQVFNSYTSQLAANSQANGAYAIGRYAYVVYDTSGLIDINVAGYPSGASASTPAKGSLPWADLTQLTNAATPVISQTPDIDNLVNWRNAANTSAYASYVTNTWATNGFMLVAPGDTTFLSRQDLIQYAQTQNSDLTNALPFLTTFSRELAGPTWAPSMTTTNCPANNYNYTNYQFTSTGGTNDNVFVLNPRVLTGHTFVRSDGTTSVAGEPLIKHRFDLTKLALLEKQGTVGLSAQDVSDIQQYFGLDLVSDSNGLYRHWSYPTASTTYPHTTGRILTLDEVAALGREPDFFEMLQAGILQGTVGYHYAATAPPFPTAALTNSVRGDYRASAPGIYWTFDASPSSPDSDTRITYQILRIGANLIDQWDADSYPTTLTFIAGSGVTQDVYGIEDLPYINELFVKAYSAMPGSTITAANYTSYTNYPYLYAELWNPHQQPANASSSSYPSTFRISPEPLTSLTKQADWYITDYQGTGGFWYWNGSAWTTLGGAIQYFSSLPNNGNIAFNYSPTTAANNYRDPGLITNGPSATAPQWSSSLSLAAWALPPMPMPNPTNLASGSPINTWGGELARSPLTWRVILSTSTILRLQYQDTSGAYRTYGTFVGDDNTNTVPTGPIGAPVTTGWYFTQNQSGPSGEGDTNTTDASSTSYPKSDPRTGRYGAGDVNTAGASPGSSPGLSLTPSSTSFYLQWAFSPFDLGNNYRLDQFAINDPTVVSKTCYPSSDMVYRPGDGRNTYQTPNFTCPLFYTGNTVNRPVILNRPFQSVGELGYAFRDEPWKTLNLSSPTSADAALLDLFTLGNSPTVIAGRVNPNSPYPQVLAALISGAAQNVTGGTAVSSASAETVAANITTSSAAAPFMNRAAIATGAFTTNSTTLSALSGIKTQEEAAVRAVADSANTRTWNFMIDIVAQVGQYPDTAKTLDDFVVNGERRYWLHIAIDRYTGQVVDKQLEIVNE